MNLNAAFNRIYQINYRKASFALIILGITIRIYNYLLNRSLWLDEAMLSNNIIHRNFLQLLQPLDNRQVAPIGFLYVQKLFVILFGTSEYALRLFPLIAGILSVVFLYYLLIKIGNEKIAFIGLSLFIFGKNLIYYSGEAKQYNIDVLVYIVCFYVLYFNSPLGETYSKVIWKGLFGALVIWFSHIAIFVLTAIGLATGLEIIIKKKYNKIVKYIILSSFWIISFGINYFLFIAHHPYESSIINSHKANGTGYFPPIPFTLKEIPWLFSNLKNTIEFPFGITPGIVLAVFIILGLIYVLKNRKNRILALIIPILIHLTLSYLYFYPYNQRFILYTATFDIVFIAFGMQLLVSFNKKAGIIISGLVLVAAIIYPIRYSFTPTIFEEIKPSLKFVKNNISKDDYIYVFGGAVPSFEYYQEKYFDYDQDVIKGKWLGSNLKIFDKELKELKNKGRVWIILSHYNENEKNYILKRCSQEGKHLKHFEYGEASADLYSFVNSREGN